jgi:hypothetical protein
MMNIEKIEDAYFMEDKYNNALEAERMAYIRGDLELARAYGMVAELFHELRLLKDEIDD